MLQAEANRVDSGEGPIGTIDRETSAICGGPARGAVVLDCQGRRLSIVSVDVLRRGLAGNTAYGNFSCSLLSKVAGGTALVRLVPVRAA